MFIDVFVLSDDTAEFNQVNAALISIFKMDARGEFLFPLGENWNAARPVLIIKMDVVHLASFFSAYNPGILECKHLPENIFTYLLVRNIML